MRSRGVNGTDHQARYNVGALEQRVYGLEQGVAGLSSQISGLSQQLTAGVRTNWPLFYGFGGLFLSIVIAVGALAYWPIRETQADLKAIVVKLADGQMAQGERMTREFVTVRELDQRSGRTRAELDRLNMDVNAQEISLRRYVEQQDANQQRQIDDLKRFNTDLVSAPAFIKNLDDRMRAIERSRTP